MEAPSEAGPGPFVLGYRYRAAASRGGQVKETLKTLLLRTRTLMMNNHQLRQRMSDEQQDLEDIRWSTKRCEVNQRNAGNAREDANDLHQLCHV